MFVCYMVRLPCLLMPSQTHPGSTLLRTPFIKAFLKLSKVSNYLQMASKSYKTNVKVSKVAYRS